LADVAAMSPPIPATIQATRAQRLLAAMHPVCSHDLPNQVVALQSLLQLFEWDEAENLTAQGREHYGRLRSIAAKTFAHVQFLREIVRLERHVPERAKLTFAQIHDDVRAEVHQRLSESTWQWDAQWDVERLIADRRLVQLGVVQLLRGACGIGPATWRVRMHTAAKNDGVEWTIATHLQGNATPAASEAALLEQRLALTLAQEYLAATDIACRPAEGSAPGATVFSLTLANRSSHG
jgi:light-regulated signal transduction histidine kinase (bacteriophytochrome)